MCNRRVVYEGDTEYHIVLPSNACWKTHPDNTPSKYTVSWETPYQLYDLSRWRVAMTEITFNHIITSINPNYGIEYGRLITDQLSFKLDIQKHPIIEGQYNVSFKTRKFNGDMWPTFHSELVKVENVEKEKKSVHYKLRFSCMQYFEITYMSNEIRTLLGMENNVNLNAQREENVTFDDEELRWELIGNDIIKSSAFEAGDGYVTLSTEDIYRMTTREKQIHIKMIATNEQYVRQEAFYFTENKYFSTIPSLVDYVNQQLPSYILKQPLSYDMSSKRCNIMLNEEEVKHVRFLNGFNYVLGFENMQYDANNQIHVGAYKPQLTLGLRCMYIYASICKPIQVGDVQVPLLQTVWPDDQRQGGGKYSLFQTHTATIERPMYLGVNTSSINSIEINIRSDSGEFVSFPPNSITSIKLHLKKI